MSNMPINTKKTKILVEAIQDFCDVFGQIPNIRVLNKPKHTSTAGLILTFLLTSALLSYLITEIIAMLEKASPSMVTSEELIFETSDFQLKNENFTLAISVADANLNSIEGINRYYNMEIMQCERKREEDLESGNITINNICTQIPFETCSTTHYFTTDLQKTYFQRIKLGSLQCINKKYLNDSPPTLQGQVNAMSFKYIQIVLTICQNSTEMNSCAPKEEIEAKLQAAQYNIYSSEYLLQLTRSSEPFQQIITPYFSSFSSTSSKKISQHYEIVETVSDDGILFESTKTETNLKKDNFEQFSELYNGQYLITHYIAISSIKTNYYRSYIKIQTILAKVGGIWQIIIFIVSILFRKILYDLMLLRVSEKLFYYQDENSNSNLVCSKESKNMEQEKSSSNNFSPKEKQLFSSSFPLSIKIIFGCDKQKSTQFKKARTKIMENLDIVKIIRKLQKLDILTSLLLNEKQISVLNVISKPQMQAVNETLQSLQKRETIGLDTNRDVNCTKLKLNHKGNIVSKQQSLQLTKDIYSQEQNGLENQINEKLITLLVRQSHNGMLNYQVHHFK